MFPIFEMSMGQMAGIFFCFGIISACGVLVANNFHLTDDHPPTNQAQCILPPPTRIESLKGFLFIFGALLLIML